MIDFPEHVIILHGYAETSKKVWFPWVRKRLERRGVHVDIPDMPDPLRPHYVDWVKTAKTALRHASQNTLVIGHSLGGVAALRALEDRKDGAIGGLLTIGSPFCSTIKVDLLIKFFEHEVAWDKVRASADQFTVLHAQDDPLVPYDHAYRYAENLEATLKLTKKGGHFTAKSSTVIWESIESMLTTIRRKRKKRR